MYQNKEIRLSNGEILLVQWESGWNNFKISHKGLPLGDSINKDILMGGRHYSIDADTKIMAVLRGKELEIWQDGKELISGLASGQTNDFKNAINWLFGIGGISIGAIVILLYFDPVALNAIFLIPGVIFVSLGFWAKYARSKTPLIIAMGLVGILLLLAILGINITGAAIQAVFGYYLYKGIRTPEHLLQRKKKMEDNDPLDANF